MCDSGGSNDSSAAQNFRPVLKAAPDYLHHMVLRNFTRRLRIQTLVELTIERSVCGDLSNPNTRQATHAVLLGGLNIVGEGFLALLQQ